LFLARILCNAVERWLGKEQAVDFKGGIKPEPDPRALAIYEHNIRALIALNRGLGVQPVFISQVLNNAAFTSNSTSAWLPYIRDRDVPRFMAAYNNRLALVCREQHVPLIDQVLWTPWTPGDFVDNGHFSDGGNQKFAILLADILRRRGLLPATRQTRETHAQRNREAGGPSLDG
ncbi:MAG TPA: hypothetical protein VMU17_01810, partial [Elusimicrobiota bacterium]|nr:hypothetical protein [Elusimicrobiota bacterium]